jgi:hypothetical protein
MPYTFAHPAAILPLRRFRALGFLPLVVGSIAPDTPYYMPQNFARAFPNSHTFEGSLLVSLPAGLLALWLVVALRVPLTALLWEPHRSFVCEQFDEFLRRPYRWLWAVPALLIGIWLHIGWDAFTHYDGWVVEHTALLRRGVTLFGQEIDIYLLLQYLSSLVGLMILAVWYRAQVLRARLQVRRPTERDWRPAALLSMLLLAAASGLLAAYESPPDERASFYLMASTILTMGSAVLALEVLTVGTVVAVNDWAQRRESEASPRAARG